MKTRFLLSVLLTFFCIGFSHSQLTHIQGPTHCALPNSGGTSVGAGYTAYPTNLSTYEWTVVGAPSNTSVFPSGIFYTTYPTVSFQFYDVGYYTIRCKSGNSMVSLNVTVVPYSYKSISYNPTINELRIEPTNTPDLSNSVFYQIINLTTGKVSDNGYLNNQTESIDVSKLPKGIYVFNTTIDKEKKSYKFTIK